ncbi:MAG TPA: FAD-binding oxidoreductase [Conexibacter sp.]|nr:FAD-binding oxidoreductase [Conexibacter sp.]
MRVGEVSFWMRALGAQPRRAPLPGPLEVDVAIVGAGFTGLWTAYYLARAEPGLRIAVLEREFAGFGASGRNGGWVSGFLSGPARVYARHGGPRGVAALQRAMLATVDEVGAVLAAERIDADWVKGGGVGVACDGAQAARLGAEVAAAREWGLGPDDLRLLDADELAARVRVAGARGGTFTPHVARVDPAKLVRGLAAAVERRGVAIYEDTAVTEVRPHVAVTARGEVRARWVVRATEGYTPGLRGAGRTLVPVNSSMVATAPLGAAVWDELGWAGRETLHDAAHVYVYAQRTADDRIALGGRGVPYRYGSATDRRGETPAATIAALRAALARLFPAAADAEIAHAWSGVIGVSRDWCATVDADPRTGLAWAGGYVGRGVAAANLAGRTLRDLILGADSELTRLPWVGRRPRAWEPEPLRWLGIRGVYALYRRADAREARSGRPSRLAALADRVSGRA